MAPSPPAYAPASGAAGPGLGSATVWVLGRETPEAGAVAVRIRPHHEPRGVAPHRSPAPERQRLAAGAAPAGAVF